MNFCRLLRYTSFLAILFCFAAGTGPIQEAEAHTGPEAGSSPAPKVRILRSASELPYPPFALVSPEGEADGFSVELLRAAAGEMGMEVTFSIGPWNDILQSLKDGRIDVLPLVSYSPGRDLELDFSKPYLHLHGAVFVRKGEEDTVQNEKDLMGLEVLVMKGDTAHEYALKRNLTDKLILTDSYEEAMRLLSEGRHDAVLVQQVAGLEIIKKLGLNNIVTTDKYDFPDMKPSGDPLHGFEQEFCFAVREGDSELLTLLNEGLAITISNGEYDRLYQKWFGPLLPERPVDLVQIFKYSGLILIPVLFVMGITWVVFLRREVKKKTAHLNREIEDRKQAEKALIESKQRWRLILVNMPQIGIKLDPEGRIIFANEHFLTLTGWDSESIIGKKWVDHFIPEDIRGEVDEVFRKTMAGEYTGGFSSYENVILTRSGEMKNVHWSNVITQDASGGIIDVACLGVDLTERYWAEKKLRAGEERLRLAMEGGRIGSWDYNAETDEVVFSPLWGELLGFTPDEIVHHINFWKDLIHPDDKQRVNEALRNHMEGISPNYSCEHRLKHKNGEWIWVIGIGEIMERNSRGRPVRVSGIMIDISRRKKAEEAFRTGEARLREAQRMAKVGSWEFDVETSLVWGSDEAFRIYGIPRTPDNQIPLHVIQGCIPEWDTVNQSLVDLINQGAPYDLEININPADGSAPKIINSKAKLEVDSEGCPVRVTGVVMDITERKKAEEDREHLFQLIDNADSIAVMKDTDLRYLNVNRSYLKLTGHTDIGMLIGKTDAELMKGLATDEQIREYMENDRKALLLPEGEYFAVQERFPDDHGGIRTFLTKKFPVYSHMNGKLLGVATHSTEITDLKNMEESLRSAKEEAEIANKTKSEFLANMSHEIRTPLNGLMGMLQLLNATHLDNEQKGFVNKAVMSSRRLTRLLSDILDLARVEAGKIQISYEAFDFRDAMDAVVQLFGPGAGESGLELSLHINPDIPNRLEGDVSRLQQVLTNLVGNAVKFTAEGFVRIDAHPIPGRTPEEYRVLITVADTGIGIADTLLNKLFTPFVQAETDFQRRYQGAGLGLTISKRLVELMGGNMAVESFEGKGSTFYVNIPFKTVDSLPAPKEPAADPVQSSGLRILLAEDDRISKISAVQLMENMGHTVAAVENGRQVLETLKAGSFDIILMDVQMPIMDGVEATRAIRMGEAGEGKKDITIIAMTAYAMEGDRERLIKSGMNAYLPKPVEITNLQKLLADQNIRK